MQSLWLLKPNFIQYLPIMKIGLLLYPDCMPAGLFVFTDLMESANKRAGARTFELTWVSLSMSPVTCAHGRALPPERRLEDVDLDALLIPGLWGSDDISTMLQQHGALIDAIAGLDRRIALWSYCTGVSVMAATGRLNRHEATITWWMAERAQQLFPHVEWRPSETCIADGRYITASGANGYLPIGLKVIETACGESITREITKLLVLPRPEREFLPFQSVDLIYLEDKFMQTIFLWVEKTQARDLTVANLAKHLHMSERSIARKVKATIGRSCAKFMEQVKLNQASEQLILTSRSISQISDDIGYLDDTTFRRAFKRVTGRTPGQYREMFKR